MNLIEVNIQEVTRSLPEKNREDIALELRSTIADMLPEHYGEEEVKDVLGKLGSPVKLAANYQERPLFLIGPRYFDIYVMLLKFLLPIPVVAGLLSVIAQFVIGQGVESMAFPEMFIEGLGIAIWRIIEVGVHVCFWLTLYFYNPKKISWRSIYRAFFYFKGDP